MSNKVFNRCSSAKVQLKQSNGQPLANTDVHFELKNHEFLFGCGAFDSMELVKEKLPEEVHSFYQDRVDKWDKVFNYGTMSFYWGVYEPTEGEPLEANRMAASMYLVEKGNTIKGHPLCWHTACADWLLKYDNKTIMDKQLERIHRDVTAFKGVIDKWDVINETVIMPVFDRYDNAITRICNAYGRTTLIKEVFDAAHAANPNAQLLINDFNLSEEYKNVIDECLNAGVPINAIGIQSHQHQGYRGDAWLEETLNRYRPFGLPMHFTENTLISGELMPPHIIDLNDWQVEEWPSTPEGEERQSREWEHMMRRLFDEPLVEAVTGWDFADGAWLNAPSGIVRKDNSLKPVYHMMDRLIHEEWHTSVDLRTDENGYVTLDGYRGLYEVKAGSAAAEFALKKAGSDEVIVL